MLTNGYRVSVSIIPNQIYESSFIIIEKCFTLWVLSWFCFFLLDVWHLPLAERYHTLSPTWTWSRGQAAFSQKGPWLGQMHFYRLQSLLKFLLFLLMSDDFFFRIKIAGVRCMPKILYFHCFKTPNDSREGTSDSRGSLPEKIPRANPGSAASLSLHRLQEEFWNFNLSTSSTNNSFSIYLCKVEKQQDLRCSMETVTPQINKVSGVRLCSMLQARTTAYRVWEH